MLFVLKSEITYDSPSDSLCNLIDSHGSGYEFYPRNHSIVRADYEYPCIPYELVNTRPGFFSGWRPVDGILDDPPTYTVRVNDTEPIFVYCSGPWACIDHGMVAVVNPNANTSLEEHRQMAYDASFVLQPGKYSISIIVQKLIGVGDDWPAEGEGHQYSVTASQFTQTVTARPTSISTPVETAPATTSSAIAASTSGSSNGLSGGAIAGIAIGVAAVLLLGAIAIWVCGRRSNRNRQPEGSGTWFLNGKKDLFGSRSGTATPATMPPAYNPHGVPVMTQNKAYPAGVTSTNVVEHYIPGTGSPPPPISPYYAQHSFPPHITDPAAFHHAGFVPTRNPVNQIYTNSPPQQQYAVSEQRALQPQRSEIYSGTPAPYPASFATHAPVSSMNPSTAPVLDRNSVSLSGNSRGGSPDPMAEMNAARSQAGTLNQAGGGILQQPMPLRAGGDYGNDDKSRWNV